MFEISLTAQDLKALLSTHYLRLRSCNTITARVSSIAQAELHDSDYRCHRLSKCSTLAWGGSVPAVAAD